MDNAILWLNTNLPSYSLVLSIILALLLDKILGETRQFHYLVGFGWLAQQLEKHLNPNHKKPSENAILSKTKNNHSLLVFNAKAALWGTLAWGILVLPIPLLYYCLLTNLVWYWQIVLDASILYLALGLNSLNQHAMQVYLPLKEQDLSKARHFTGYLVSRETQALTPNEMSRATVESMLENGHDSVIASIVYFIIGGAPLVILHRFANTLDAMWGYRTAQFNAFGFASAKLDDLLGFISAKICTLLYALQAKSIKVFNNALCNAYKQGNQYKSHNGGWVMASGATILNRKLGGVALYEGKAINSVTLGCGNTISLEDIPQSILLVERAALILTLMVLLFTIAF